MQKISGNFLVLFTAAFIVSAVTIQTSAQDTTNDEKRIERVEKQLRALQRKIFGSDGSPVEEIDQNPVATDSSGRKLMADLSVKISSLEQQMREITGRLEAIEYAQEQYNKKLELLTKDTSIRFEEMRTTEATPAPSTSVGVVTVPEKAPELTLPAGTVDSQFQWAFSYVSKNDLENGQKALDLFLEANPTGDLSANAHFWLGRVNLQDRKFGKAAEQFLHVFEGYPKHKKAPESLVELGNALMELGENNSACEAYLEFRRSFPDANARLASRVEAGEKKAKC